MCEDSGAGRQRRSYSKLGCEPASPEAGGARDDKEIGDEGVCIAGAAGTTYLYLYSRATDLVAAAVAFFESSLPIDTEFKTVMAECLDLESSAALELLFSAEAQTGESWHELLRRTDCNLPREAEGKREARVYRISAI